jgi:hypothetical protein
MLVTLSTDIVQAMDENYTLSVCHTPLHNEQKLTSV